MDKKRRNLLIGSALLAPPIINKLVFFTATKKYPMLDAFHIYEWRLGKIGYSVKRKRKTHSSYTWRRSRFVIVSMEKYRKFIGGKLQGIQSSPAGYGTSDRAKTTYTAYTYASMIDDFVTDVIGKPAAVIAQGEGAVFAAAACMKNPSNYKKLVFVCPKGINDRLASKKDKRIRMLYELPIIGESLYLMKVSFSSVKKRMLDMIYNSEKTKILTDCFYSSAHYGGGKTDTFSRHTKQTL